LECFFSLDMVQIPCTKQKTANFAVIVPKQKDS
jgi:hypothetical protein